MISNQKTGNKGNRSRRGLVFRSYIFTWIAILGCEQQRDTDSSSPLGTRSHFVRDEVGSPALEHCSEHNIALRKQDVPVHYGLVDLRVFRDNAEARALFPHAGSAILVMSCIPFQESSRTMLVCESCRQDKNAWLALHRNLLSPKPFPHEVQDFLFLSDEGFQFDARMVVPPEHMRNGFGVLLIGGGIGNDLLWSVPGRILVHGQEHNLTISGFRHNDASTIARALADAGFTVCHWSTIRRGDPKADTWPMEATMYPMVDQVRYARSALSAFCDQGFIEQERVFLLGHSLGGHRAVNIAAEADGLAGLILLASAAATRTTPSDSGTNTNRTAAANFVSLSDTNDDGLCDRQEFEAWCQRSESDTTTLCNTPFEQIDFDKDSVLRLWEVSACLSRVQRASQPVTAWAQTDRYSLRWTEDVISERPIPTLFLYGSLDNAQAHHAPILAERFAAHDGVTVRVLPDLGHQLGPEHEGRIGAVSDAALVSILDWLHERVHVHRSQGNAQE